MASLNSMSLLPKPDPLKYNIYLIIDEENKKCNSFKTTKVTIRASCRQTVLRTCHLSKCTFFSIKYIYINTLRSSGSQIRDNICLILSQKKGLFIHFFLSLAKDSCVIVLEAFSFIMRSSLFLWMCSCLFYKTQWINHGINSTALSEVMRYGRLHISMRR